MKKDIILAGVGGRGILTIAKVIGIAALDMGLYLKQAEVHGMSQRGGDVQSGLRLSSNPIYSDLIPLGCADRLFLWSLWRLCAICRGLLRTVRLYQTLCLRSISAIIPRMRRSRLSTMPSATVSLYSTARSLLVGPVARSANIVLLGAAAPFLDIDPGVLRDCVRRRFAGKSDAIIEANVNAFDAGLKITL